MDNTTSAAADRNIFRFLDLSAELRNRIYELALIRTPTLDDSYHKDVCDIAYTQSWEHEDGRFRLCVKKRGVRDPPLLLVNRQIRHEALGIFWSQNTFTASRLHPLLDFLQHTSPEKRKFLTSIRVHAPAWVKGMGQLTYFEKNWSDTDLVNTKLAELGIDPQFLKLPLWVDKQEIVWVCWEDLWKFKCVRGSDDQYVVVRKQVEEQGKIST